MDKSKVECPGDGLETLLYYCINPWKFQEEPKLEYSDNERSEIERDVTSFKFLDRELGIPSKDSRSVDEFIEFKKRVALRVYHNEQNAGILVRKYGNDPENLRTTLREHVRICSYCFGNYLNIINPSSEEDSPVGNDKPNIFLALDRTYLKLF